jgi:hypothetical protein
MPPNRAFLKRQKELARQEKQREKEARRKARKENRPTRTGFEGEDPDIAGIVPGPQPLPDEDEF